MPNCKASLKKKVTAQGSSKAVQPTRRQGAEAGPPAELVEGAEALAAATGGARLTYVEPPAVRVIHFTEDDFKDYVEWKRCLVWRFTEKFHGKAGVKAVSDSWNTPVRTLFYPKWVIFVFEKEEDMEKILSGGPYFAYGRPMVFKKMPKYFIGTEEDLD